MGLKVLFNILSPIILFLPEYEVVEVLVLVDVLVEVLVVVLVDLVTG